MDEPRHSAELDGLRAVAILPVLFEHLYVTENWVGAVGVRLFFVISGFLITRNLLAARDAEGHALGPTLASFFARRALRLFPAFYLCLAVLWAMDAEGVRQGLLPHAFYLSNLAFALRDAFEPWPMAAFWSLAVEEQFYLVWPFLLLLLPARLLVPMIVCVALCGPVFRTIAHGSGFGGVAATTLTPASLDALGGGALLALAARAGAVPAWPARVWTVVACAGFTAAASLLFVEVPLAVAGIGAEGFLVPGMVILVAAAAAGAGGPLGRLLAARPMVWIGRRSYGIYLYHLPVVAALHAAAGVAPWLPMTPGAGLLVVGTAATLVVAALSFRFVETPVLRLKRFFPYVRPAAQTTLPAASPAG